MVRRNVNVGRVAIHMREHDPAITAAGYDGLSRLERAQGMLRQGISPQRVDENTYAVKNYLVRWQDGQWACSCWDFFRRRVPCKHILATNLSLNRDVFGVIAGGKPTAVPEGVSGSSNQRAERARQLLEGITSGDPRVRVLPTGDIWVKGTLAEYRISRKDFRVYNARTGDHYCIEDTERHLPAGDRMAARVLVLLNDARFKTKIDTLPERAETIRRRVRRRTPAPRGA